MATATGPLLEQYGGAHVGHNCAVSQGRHFRPAALGLLLTERMGEGALPSVGSIAIGEFSGDAQPTLGAGRDNTTEIHRIGLTKEDI